MGAAENKQLMQDIFAAAAKGDGSLYRASLADDFRLIVTGQYSWSQTFEGKERALRDLYGYVATRVQPPQRTIAERFIADGDLVVVEAHGDMTTKDGQRYDNHYCLVYQLRDSKIVEMREYQDSALCERVLGPYPTSAKSAD
ncbi:MAG TPA: nuclear transport factor 2 family protein [Caulobacteraceae bacterium]|jgi:hypothetical protein